VGYDAFISYSHDGDGPVASAVQRGLQRLAKPLLRARALRVFRDDTALATNPLLWSSIERALDDSEWFVLLASPGAARSEWVARELDHWLATKSVDRVLPAVTGGEWRWDAGSRLLLGDAVPPSLREAFADEPRHLDLTWAGDDGSLNLRDVRFRGAVADLAAPIHGVPKDELESEDLRLHRRARRLTRGAVAALAALLVASLTFAVYAVVQRDRADRNARRAAGNARIADSGRLAALARLVGKDQLDLSLLLAVQARRLTRSNATDGGLQAALAAVPPGFEWSARVPRTSGVVATSPDRRLLAVPGTDDRVHLVTPSDGRVVRALAGFRSGNLGSTAFDVDGRRVLGAGDGRVTIWRVRSGAPVVSSIRAGTRAVGAAFDPADATRIFTAGNGFLRQWSVRDPARPVEISAPVAFPQLSGLDTPIVHVSRDGRLLVVGSSAARTTRVLDLASWRPLEPDLGGTPGPFSADGRTLALARGDRIVLVDPRSGAERGGPLLGFRLASPAIVVSADGRYLAASDTVDKTIRVFDLDARRQVGELALFRNPSFPVAFMPGGRLLTADAGRLLSWRFTSKATPLITPLPDTRPGTIAAQFTPDGSEVITINQADKVARRWRAADGAYLGRMLDDRAAPTRPLAFSPDGRYVIAARPDDTAGLFEVERGRLLAVLDAGQKGPPKPVWSPTGPVVALGSDDLSITLWDVSDRRRPRLRRRLQVGTARGSLEEVLYPGFSRDGRTLIASKYLAGRLIFYDLASGRRMRTLRTAIQGPNFGPSPDGTRFVFDHPRGGLAIADAATGRLRAVFEQPPSSLGAYFTAEGRRLVLVLTPLSNLSLVFSGADATDITRADTTALALYDAESFEQVGEAIALPGTVPWISGMSPDRTRFATGARNSPVGVAAVWDLDPDRWKRSACRLAGRNLSRAEWSEYLPGRRYERTCPQWPPGDGARVG
jgi:WD40 repeat protein